MLQEEVWSRVDKTVGPHTVDLITTDSNVMRSRTGEPLRHFTHTFPPKSSGVNVFAQDLSKEHNPYVYPPFHLIFPLICLLREQKVRRFIFVAPVFRVKPIWWPLLLCHTSSSLSLGDFGEKNVHFLQTWFCKR